MAGPYFVIAKVEPDYTWWEIDGPNNLGDDEDKIVGELNRLAAENAALRAEVERLREERRWIPVEERLPPNTGTYLIVSVRDGVRLARWTWMGWLNDDDATHWMPLPAPTAE